MKVLRCSSFLLLLLLSACSDTSNDIPVLHELEASRGYPEPVNLVEENLVQYVNPLMGTDSKFSLSNGNTYPSITKPWAMNSWTPMTAPIGDGWTYKYDDDKIRGIKQTHQPSPWLNDYGAFALMAVTGELKFSEDDRASWFSHKAEQASPDYYSVYLADHDVVAELTPSDRGAQFRFTFPDSDQSFVLLDAFKKGSMVKILPEQRKIVGYARNNHGGVPDNFHNYFVAVFDRDFEVTHTWRDEYQLVTKGTEESGDHVGAIIGFKTARGEQVTVKVASSFISLEQAELNLQREIANDTFDETRQKAHDTWQRELNKIRIEDSNLDNVRTFYSALYRVLQFPRSFYEFDANNQIVHYSPYNGQVLPGYMYTDNGFWDTFRAVFPFFNMMYPALNSQIMEGLANTYKESGWLPEWASPGHRGVMIGSNSAINITDAFLKGNANAEIETLYAALMKNAEVEEGRPVGSVGREGVDYYNKLGYVPYDVGIHENAARTLEYAFADFNLYQLAKRLGKTDDAAKFRTRSLNYKNLFDPETGWMRGKNADGSFQSPFNPLKWGDAFTEGNSLHYTWSVFHDIEGLKTLMGGTDAFAAKLDEVFEMPPLFDDSYYGFTIHEIREMQIVNMGNYAHGNQPIQHMIYLYNYASQPWKAQQKVREVMDVLYAATPDGYCGDEDNGQTSAWYVFSALGFYPVTPGTNQYVFGGPLFNKVTLNLENGHTFQIESTNNSKSNMYVQKINLNGQPYEKTWLSYDAVQAGGKISFQMDDSPNKQWATDISTHPYSLSLHDTAQ